MKHIHEKEIKAWADGAEIEFYEEESGTWVYADNPRWVRTSKYRVKPTPKPDEVRHTCASKLVVSMFGSALFDSDNLKLTFDGETGKLKSAEVLK